MELPLAASRFVASLRDERLASRHTVDLYARTVAAFSDFVGGGSLSQIGREHLRRFLVHLRDGGNGPATLRTKVAALRAFFSFLVDRGLRRSLPFQAEDFRIRVPRTLPHVLTQEELDRFLRCVEEQPQRRPRTPWGRTHKLSQRVRDRALFFLLAGCGLRVGEATGLDVSSVCRSRKAIRLTGKGGDIREVFYDVEPLEDHLNEYLDARLRLGVLGGALFINFRDGRRLTSRSVQMLMRRYLQLAGIDKTASPHSLRHTFATLAIERGANVKAISQLLGHRHVGTTINTYTHLSEKHVRDVFRQCHPLQEAKLPLAARIEGRKRSLPLLS